MVRSPHFKKPGRTAGDWRWVADGKVRAPPGEAGNQAGGMGHGSGGLITEPLCAMAKGTWWMVSGPSLPPPFSDPFPCVCCHSLRACGGSLVCLQLSPLPHQGFGFPLKPPGQMLVWGLTCVYDGGQEKVSDGSRHCACTLVCGISFSSAVA